MNEQWLIQATIAHKKYNVSSFGCTSLPDELRIVVEKACNGKVGCTDLEQKEADQNEHNPMDDIEVSSEAGEKGSTRGCGVKSLCYYENHGKDKPVHIDMPTKCPEEDSRGELSPVKRKITMFIVDRKQVCLLLCLVALGFWILEVSIFDLGALVVGPCSFAGR